VPAKSQAVRSVLQKAHAIPTRVGRAHLPLLDDLSSALKLGFASYYLFLGTVVAGLVIAGLHVAKVVGCDIRLWAGVLAGLLVAGVLAYWTDARFSRVCSDFWHNAQQDLKKVL
jgi:hypothetical protein